MDANGVQIWSICCVRTPVICSSLYIINGFVVERLSEISIWNCNCNVKRIICGFLVNMHFEMFYITVVDNNEVFLCHTEIFCRMYRFLNKINTVV
jgi:hypothetical protein